MSWILGQHHTVTVMVTDVLLMASKHLAATSLNICNLYCFNTVLHQSTLQGKGTTDKSNVLPPLSSNTASFVRWKINGLFNDMFSTPVNRQKQIPTLLDVICYQNWIHSLSLPPFTIPKANSTTAAQMKIEQENPIFIDSPSPKTGHFVEY
jgi:hypothetical protein